MINVEKVKPTGIFTNYIYKAIPLAFDESMSYYECLCGLLNYLKNTVMPALNNNADAIIELQTLCSDLKNYVDNYFDNLDVQEEINNKLDEMAESGELTDIIAQYLELAGVLAYNTVSDLESAINVSNGSICVCIGKNTYNDGKTAYYKIREILNTDVIDDDNIIGITNDPTLVGEKLPNYAINTLNSQINTINNTLSIMNNKKVIILGDSYANRVNSWAIQLKEMLNIGDNCVIKAVSGVGFCNTVDDVNFSTMVVDNIPLTPNEVTDIIVCGGYNDNSYTTSQINYALNSFITLVNTTYPNAKIHIGMIGWLNYKKDSYNDIITGLCNVLKSYKNCSQYSSKASYLNNVEFIMHDPDYIDESNFHPNEDGQDVLSRNILQAFLTGSCYINSYATNITTKFTVTNDNVTSSGSDVPGIYTNIDNGRSYVFTNNDWYFHLNTSVNTNLHGYVVIGTLESFIIGRSYAVNTTIPAVIKTVNSGYFNVAIKLVITGGVIGLQIDLLNRNGNGWINEPIDYIMIPKFQISCDSMCQY